MNRRLLPLLALLVAGLLGGLLLYLYLNARPYQETIDHGPSPQARANPYLAAEMFLRQRGLQVHHANGLEVLPTLKPQQNSLLLLGERSNMTPQQVEQLLDWARAGGRLLFVAEALWNKEAGRSGDLLLDRLHLRQFLSKDLKAPPPGAGKEPYPKLTKLYLEDQDAPAYIGFDTDFHLEDPDNLAQSWANSARATHMMQLSYGQGSVTVLTDAEIWKTPLIAKYDNAWLLWYLSADSDVTLLFDTDHDSLWSLLLKYFPQALVALAALLGLWLWHVGVRHGPMQAPMPRARRQLREHLQASAHFLLRHTGQQGLLHSLQQEILRRAQHRHPGFERLTAAEQGQVLARLTRQPDSVISQALAPQPAQRLSSADFSRLVTHLQTLRNAL
ncbi:DUF4350 domain-containing protein [Pseudomonas chlororaphis]|uniref:DUF4350 domain-containing protein n=1 Tax=Pseudomonas chlororaphis TaxID=587753 RepID=UPI000E0A9507|nr:DUF4350 domain-containing protein [Pseudomonas chlororaphis]AZD17618.1 hypothetical protein C4K25_4712 [Pseudomonas chlororaphis]WDH46184.1 DUF4350 domain-containing protein [Pseudomonas chlororaphis]WDH58031.1 DUF4350 domain-containing protein [Pseudomonas chlororaphis]WQE17287.1 DUF4350 domain-containing protein [Pseudomonas chlororaphis]